MSAATAAAQSHPLETIFVVLALILVVSVAFGFAPATSFFTVFFVGFVAALLLIAGGWFIQNGRTSWGIAFLVGFFVLIGAIGAGWVKF